MEEAKVVKNQRKSVLSRHVNTLRRLLIEEDTNGVIARLKSMKDTFDQLEQAHYDYIESFKVILRHLMMKLRNVKHGLMILLRVI